MQTFREAVEAKDLEGMIACLSPDVILHSPISFKPFEGHEAVRQLFSILVDVFEDFTYTDEMSGPGVEALVFRARVGDRLIQGIDIMRLGEDGLLDDFTVMVRPLSAANALAEAVGARLLH
jgi:hypothetical protein